jgi:hypothetical protein
MASLGDGVGHLSFTSLVLREGTSTTSEDGRNRKGPRTPQAVKEEITGNSAILDEIAYHRHTGSTMWQRGM